MTILKWFAERSRAFKSDFNNVEVETRMIIQKPKDFKPTIVETINYYKCDQHKNITFRSRKPNVVETKEMVYKEKVQYYNVVLSIEKTYNRSDLKLQLIRTHKRDIKRQRLQENPIVEITECDEEYTLEIEYDITNWDKVDEIIKKWKNPFWNIQKPIDISAKALSQRVSRLDQWIISPKADGVHIWLYENDDKKVLIYDKGKITDMEGNDCENIEPNNIYEGEIMDNKEILLFDCVMYQKKNISKLKYIERRKFIKQNKKQAFMLKDIESLREVLKMKFPYKTDGFILTNVKNRTVVYKSKFKTTVDLRYLNGYLYLENDRAERIKYEGKELLKENTIYEFDKSFNVIRERTDKTKANYLFPSDENQLYKIAYGIGIPSLRSFHNKVKKDLLNRLRGNNLLDIGSSRGGDIQKWIDLKFKKILAVDPSLYISKKPYNVYEIRDKFENLPEEIEKEYDCMSIFFVPWNNAFVKNKECVIAVMTRPINYQCDAFKCEVNGNKVRLQIKETNTATDITETIPELNFEKEEIIYKLKYGTEDEKILQSMYQYFYVKPRV